MFLPLSDSSDLVARVPITPGKEKATKILMTTLAAKRNANTEKPPILS